LQSFAKETDRTRAGTDQAVIEWRTFYVCPAHQNAGVSIGGLFLIASSLAGVIYLAGGVAYNRNKGHSGVENLVPQYEQWSQLPGLVAEGWWFTRVTLSRHFGLCACIAPSPKGLYEDIDGASPAGSIHGRLPSCILWSQSARGLSTGKKHRKDKKAHKHEKDSEKEKKSKKDKKSKKGDADDIETEPLKSKSKSKSKSKPVSALRWLHSTNLGQFLAS
jgi:hypothetical protein